MINDIQTSKAAFIEFLLKHQALKFGSFTLKSGRQSPYFFNLGVFQSGASLQRLGQFFAMTLEQSGLAYDMLFGPAYKGIPLAVATAIALFQDYQKDVPYCFNRKVVKSYGDGGDLVGAPLAGRVVMLDDVITAGTTVRETVALMKQYKAEFSGIVIAFDRQERGLGEQSAVQEVVDQYQIAVQSILCLQDLIEYLSQRPEYKTQLTTIYAYQQQYGVNPSTV